jgi:hypothetical protein
VEFVSVMAFYAGIPMLATLPLGFEFQYRTFPSLLIQPVDRRKIWREKILTSSVLVLTAGLVYAFGWQKLLAGDTESFMTATTWLVLAGCTAVCWTIVAQSTIGALILNVCQCMLIVLSFFLIHLLREHKPGLIGLSTQEVVGLFAAAIVGYSMFMVWLGRRALIRFQDRGPSDIAFAADRPRLKPVRFTGWLRSRPSWPLFNLIGKEIQLVWPAWVFVIDGLLVTTAIRLYPIEEPRILAGATVAAFSIATLCTGVVAFLAGILSMGEERALGTHALQMTLPASARTQWLAKLGVALATGFAGILPLTMLREPMVGLSLDIDLEAFYPTTLMWLVAFTVFIGFWCASAVKGTTRALLWLCPVLAIVLTAGGVGTVGSHLIGGGLTRSISNSRQFAVATFVFLLAAALQSYQLFRAEVQDGNQSLFRSLPVLVLLAFVWGLVR